MTGATRAVAWCGVGLGAAAAVALVVVAFTVDLNTAGQWSGIAGTVVALGTFSASMHALTGGPAEPAAAASGDGQSATVTASGRGAIAVGGNIGVAATGGAALSAAPVTMPPSTAAGDVTVEASGPGSIATRGDVGYAVTGDPGADPAGT
ncbi:hypothetical protein [Streptomyces sp. NPDC002588]|uniref:hypothetical protein n=1 Tax=Streptomyces sp. NPDC002588 TaxID=3154419 RepID=UPI003325C20F